MTLRGVSMRIERRGSAVKRWSYVAPLVAAALAAVLAGALLLVTGHDPVSTYWDMIDAAFVADGAFSATLASATPLLFTGLAAAIAFRARAWNIGGEGQLYAGAICAAAAGIAFGDDGLGAALPTMLLAGIVGGALWGAIPGLLRAYLHTNEILTSLMLNYVAGLLMFYLIYDSYSYWRDMSSPAATQFPQAKELDPGAFWPTFSVGDLTVPLGFLIAVLLAVALFFFLRTTRFWFQVAVMSDSPKAGAYAGISTKWTFVLVMCLSGALAGLAGASQIGDFSHVLEPPALQVAAFGYTGIVAAALARYNPIGVVLGAICLGALTNAGFKLQGPDFPHGLVGSMQGIILFCVLGTEFFARRRVVIERVQDGPARRNALGLRAARRRA
jgi:simple sugar transport system permease protein